MSDLKAYHEALARFYTKADIPEKYSPAALIDSWQAFIADCASVYSFDLSEYDNDLEVRRYIQLLLEAPELQSFPQLAEFERQVDELDARFRILLLPNIVRPAPTEYWWDQGILKQAGLSYVDDVANLYGITLAPCMST